MAGPSQRITISQVMQRILDAVRRGELEVEDQRTLADMEELAALVDELVRQSC